MWRRWLPKIARELTCLKKSLPFHWRQACLPANLKDRKHSGIINSSRYSFHLGGSPSSNCWFPQLSDRGTSAGCSRHQTALCTAQVSSCFQTCPQHREGRSQDLGILCYRLYRAQEYEPMKDRTRVRQNACKASLQSLFPQDIEVTCTLSFRIMRRSFLPLSSPSIHQRRSSGPQLYFHLFWIFVVLFGFILFSFVLFEIGFLSVVLAIMEFSKPGWPPPPK